MTYKEQYLFLKQKTADAYNLWIKAQNQLATRWPSGDEDGFLNEQLWENLEVSALDLQKKIQNEFNKFCAVIKNGQYSADDILGDQQACA